MNGYCENVMPGGFNADCMKPPSPIKAIGLCPKGTSFTTRSDILNKITWKTKIQVESDAMFYLPVLSYEVTSTAPNNEESTSGQKEITKINPPSGTFYIDAGVCNYNELQATLDGGDYDCFLFLQDGTIMYYEGDVSQCYGFTANVTAGGNDLPMPDSKAQSFPVYINFEQREQFMARKIVKPAWSPVKTLKTYMPDGYHMSVKTVYNTTTGVVVVWVRKRSGAVVTGLVTADFEALYSNDLDMSNVSITATDNSDGTYDLLIQKDAVPTDLVAGDYVGIRVKKLTSTVIDALSNRRLIEAE